MPIRIAAAGGRPRRSQRVLAVSTAFGRLRPGPGSRICGCQLRSVRSSAGYAAPSVTARATMNTR